MSVFWAVNLLLMFRKFTGVEVRQPKVGEEKQSCVCSLESAESSAGDLRSVFTSCSGCAEDKIFPDVSRCCVWVSHLGSSCRLSHKPGTLLLLIQPWKHETMSLTSGSYERFAFTFCIIPVGLWHFPSQQQPKRKGGGAHATAFPLLWSIFF